MKDQIQTTWTVGELFDFKNGQFIKVQEFFLNYNLKDEEDQDRLIELRHELELAIQKKIAAKYGCWYCKGLASLRAVRSDKRIIYFKAIHSLECKEKSKNLSREQISRIKYNGQQEGELHLILKRKIAELLELNKINKGEIQEVVIEKPRKLTTDPSSHEWKKPDIFTHFYKNKCIYNIAFELQLSTTFLDVVISRQDFYKRDGSYIIWVFNNFDHERRNQKMMQLDIVVSNNKNAFVINEITIAESYKVNDLVLICHYKSYHRKGSEIVSKWNEQLITLSDLCFDDDYKVYYYNSDAEYNNLNKQIQIENKSCELTRVKEYEQKTNGTYIGNEGQVIEILSSEDKIHEILDLLKKIYNSNSEVNDLYWWINRKIYALQEIDVQYLNKKLKFNTLILKMRLFMQFYIVNLLKTLFFIFLR
jgi:competence CoiA-like predicted nuclease